MDIWHYDPRTGALREPGLADPSPVEPGAWILPAFATDVAPPAIPPGEWPHWRDGAWELRALPVPPPPPEPDLAALARARRDALLAASDWTMLPYAPLSAEALAAWREYRTALRALPQQPGFPRDITWPAPPVAKA